MGLGVRVEVGGVSGKEVDHGRIVDKHRAVILLQFVKPLSGLNKPCQACPTMYDRHACTAC